MAKEFKKGKMVPVPSHSIVPERDVNKLPVLECQHLGIDFGGLTAVNEFNLTIGRTEIAGLIGPNGAGKTTVFNLLTKVYQPTRGTILLNGKDTHGMSTAQVNRAGIARTFQNIRLFSNLSVEDNVKIGLHNQIRYPMWDGVLRLPKFWKQEKLARESAMELLSIFDMQDLAGAKSGSLPYGAQRRLEIVRADTDVLHYRRVGKEQSAEIILNNGPHLIVRTAFGKQTEVNPGGFTILVEDNQPQHVGYFKYY